MMQDRIGPEWSERVAGQVAALVAQGLWPAEVATRLGLDVDVMLSVYGAAVAGAWRAGEVARCRAAVARGRAPEAAGPDVPVAPARAYALWAETVLVPQGADGWAEMPGGWRGRAQVRVADAWCRMAAAAERNGCAPPFAAAEVAVGRRYAALAERVAAAGVSCSALEVRVGGGAGDVMERRMAQRARLQAMRRAIGDGLVCRRVRPSARGSRRDLSVRALVDGVCLGDLSVSDVLATHGWRRRVDLVAEARAALAAALRRMEAAA